MNNRQAASVLREISPARIFARPTAEDLWLGPTRESVLSHLMVQAPTRALLGPTSSGRSSLLRHIAHCTSSAVTALRVPGPQTEAEGVLRALLRSTGLDTERLQTNVMRRLITVYVQERLGKNRRVVIEVDDGDAFNTAAWQEIEYLLNLSASGRSPELLVSLAHLDDENSPAAIHVRAQDSPTVSTVAWLNPNEVSDYLHWRLDRFDLSGITSPAATRLIAKCTSGCFASVDHICQMSLLLLRSQEGNQINVNIVREAMRMLKRQHQGKGASEAEPSAFEPVPATLIVSQDGKVIRETLLADRMLIGRSELNDLCIENAYLSRHHAVILRTEKGYHLSDLNSVNGLTLNGQPVYSTPIASGDVFRIGPFRVKLKLAEPISAQSSGNTSPALLADTAVMPGPDSLEPAQLKVIK